LNRILNAWGGVQVAFEQVKIVTFFIGYKGVGGVLKWTLD